MQEFKEVKYEDHGLVKEITLNNPKRFNILSLAMMDEITKILVHLESDKIPSSVVILKGSGDHFCSGGNLFEVASPQGGSKYVSGFFQIVHRIFTSKKHKFVSFVKGFAIGSGLSLSIACQYSIALENTLAGMPETKIGTCPNSGIRFLQFPNNIGKYLWLSSALLSGKDLVRCGVFTNYMEKENLEKFEADLKQMKKLDELDILLNKYSTKLEGEYEYLNVIKQVYSHEKIEDIYREAEKLAATEPLAEKIVAELDMVAPLALKVSTELWNRLAKTKDITEAINLEVNTGIGMTKNKDLLEGLQVLRKKKSAAEWQHKSIFDVKDEEVQKYLVSGPINVASL